MTCSEFQDALIEAGRGAAPDPATAAHLRQCEPCELFLQRQKALTEGFGALAAGETRGPSAALERALLRKVKPVRQRRWEWMAVAGAAAAVALIFVPRPSPEPPVLGHRQASSVVANPAISPDVALIAHKRYRRRAIPLRPVRVQEPEENEFVGIPYSAPLDPHERAELLRVNMPVAALAAWGLPIGGANPGLRVNADLLLGEDGLARAVRVVQ